VVIISDVQSMVRLCFTQQCVWL